MSADAWRKCPKCKVDKDAIRNAAIASVRKKYGKVKPEDYDAMMAKASAVPDDPKADEDTLREDYELRTDEEGVFSVNYSCGCSRCGFSFSYKHEENAMKES